MEFVEVSVAAKHAGRQFYTYSTNESLAIGTIIEVPFGKNTALGIVRNIVKKPTFETKNIVQILPFVLPDNSINLLLWLEQFYPYDYGEITKLFIPPNPFVKPRQIKKDETLKPVIDMPSKTQDQSKALNVIEQNKHIVLHGKTGTGKTRVFTEYANEILTSGKSVLLLTPEIGLTPQLIKTIEQHCPYPVFVTHSQMTPAKRRQSWEAALYSKQPSIFIGPRSSLFLPINQIGLIVLDEAHDQSYKNMQSPRYNGVYVASSLAKIHSATFVQSTATPNISDLILAKQKNIPVVTMSQIAAGEQITKGTAIDINDRKKFTKNKLISDELLGAVESALKATQQSLLFLNRRGSARVVQCNSCGHTEECPNCGLPITFHHDSYTLNCHLCGYSKPARSQCSKCNGTDMLFFSPGTKGLEQEISKLFPNAKIARFDLDVKSKDSLHKNIENIKDGSIDIVVGTQLITKGLDLPNLSVVGVLNADSAMQLPDFRSEEIAFQQLYQVTGRVGRGHIKSEFFIQTRQPNHPIIESALERNWQSFYDYESSKRKQYHYPPYTNLAILKITKSKLQTVESSAGKLANKLAEIKGVTVLGPSPSFYEYNNGKYTWQIVLKSKSRAAILNAALQAPSEWTIDIDPLNLL